MPFLQLVTDVTSGCGRRREPALSQVAMIEAGFLNGHLAVPASDRSDTRAGPIRDCNILRFARLLRNALPGGLRMASLGQLLLSGDVRMALGGGFCAAHFCCKTLCNIGYSGRKRDLVMKER